MATVSETSIKRPDTWRTARTKLHKREETAPPPANPEQSETWHEKVIASAERNVCTLNRPLASKRF